MGTYLNPGNGAFAELLSGDYIDKTGRIKLINFAKFLKAKARRQETVSDEELLSVSVDLIEQNRKAYEVLAQ